MEARNCATRDRDECKREQLAGEHRPFAGRRERRQRRHPQRWQDHQDRDAKHDDRRDLEECREVVARAEQHPDGQHRCDEAVGDHHPGERYAALAERRGERRVSGDPAAGDQRNEQQQRAHDRRLADFARPPALHPPAHQQRDGDRTGDRKQAPRRGAQCVHDDQREHREQDDHDREHGHHCRRAGDSVDFLLRHLAERLAVAPQRTEEDREVLHRAAHHDPDDEPQRAG